MIAEAKPSPRPHSLPDWHTDFMAMMPSIKKRARIALKDLDPEARADAVEEVIAQAYCTFARLVELGKDDLAYPTPLATYAIRQFRTGRRVGGQLNIRDLTSRHCQVHKGIRVGRLDHYDREEEGWKEILIEDRHAGPAETAIAKIDIGNWFKQLKPRDRAIASYLAVGHGTNETAKAFRVTKGRIAQKRREFLEGWRRFQGEHGQDPWQ